jgi:nucleotide-binding universal stress UspA family protein
MQSKPNFKGILVPTDGSLPSTIAEELTAFIAKKFKSKVTVIHVITHELMHPELQRFSAESPEFVGVPTHGDRASLEVHVPETPGTSLQENVYREISEWYREHGEDVVGDALALFKEEGISADQKLIEHADPAETIIQEAEKGSYDLIAIGHSGEKGEELRLGSVANKVSRHAKTPVLIARQKRQISRMLVPVDGSENAEKALQYAALLAEKTDAKMTLLYVQEPSLFRLRPQVAKEIGTRVLARAVSQVKGIKLDQKLESGHPAKMIIQTAKEGDYDVIVMGSHGHSSARRFLLGSVSDYVIHYADRSVLLIK